MCERFFARTVAVAATSAEAAYAVFERIALRLRPLIWAALCVLSLVPEASLAAVESLGPPGGIVTAIAVDPLDPELVYASTESGGVFRSMDAGAQWEPTNTNGNATGLISLAILATTPPTLVGGTNVRGALRSTDGGRTWNAVSGQQDLRRLYSIAQSPQHAYAVGVDGVFLSMDAGASWHDRSSGIDDRDVTALGFDAHDPSVLYAGAASGAVYRSTDGGDQWRSVSAGLPSARVTSLAVAPGSPLTAYVALFSHGIFRTTNGGQSWQYLDARPFDVAVWDLAIHPTAPRTVYALTAHERVLRSQDAGASWQSLDGGAALADLRFLTLDPSRPDVLYAGARGRGISKSLDRGGTWAHANTGLSASSLYSVAVDPRGDDTIYVGANGAGVLRTTNHGADWSELNEGRLGAGYTADLLIDRATPATLLSAEIANSGVLRSEDGGTSWSKVLTANVTSLAANPDDAAVVYAATRTGGVFRSDDGGLSWQPANAGLAGLDIRTVAVDPRAPSTAFAGPWQGPLFGTTDAGTTWVALTDAIGPVFSIVVEPDADTILVGAFSGLYRIRPAERTSEVLVGHFTGAIALGTDADRSIFIGGSGLWRSRDRGGTWQRLDGGDAWRVHDIALAPERDDLLYVATDRQGLLAVTIDDTAPFTPNPTPTLRATACAGDCGADGEVSIGEIITAVNLVLFGGDVSSCPQVDVNGDARVAVNEVIGAINSALCGCGRPCPTPPPTPTRTPTPRATPTLPPTTVPTPTPPTAVIDACDANCATARNRCGDELFFDEFESVADCTDDCVSTVEDFASDVPNFTTCADAQVRYIRCCTQRGRCGEIPDGCSGEFRGAVNACGGSFGGCPLIFF